jgi:pyrophosphatase PpaX
VPAHKKSASRTRLQPSLCYDEGVTLRTFFPRAVLFDWDGTLLDSYAADVRAYAAMFRALEIEWEIEQLEKFYSPNWYHVYRAARVPRKRWDEADRLWRAAYAVERPKLLPGARAVFQTLARRFDLGIVTSGSGDRVRGQLRNFRFADAIAVCVCSEDVPKKKPHPMPLLRAIKQLCAKPEDCVYVGDTPQDVEMARRAGVPVIGVLGPFPSAKRMAAAKPDLLLDSIRDLPRHLKAPRASRKK